MGGEEWLAERFEEHRARLRQVAYRMLGSLAEADDAVQDAWLRASRAGAGDVDNLGGWLTTVVARLCLDMLRTRKSRREEPLEAVSEEYPPPALSIAPTRFDPEEEIAMADSVGLAMLAVLENLTPAERVAFVLHDMFAVPFEEIAPVIGRSVEAARQLASRARRRVQGGPPDRHVERRRRREIVNAFIAASRGGDFTALLELLDPDVVLRGDAAAVRLGGHAEIRGSPAVAAFFRGNAQAAVPAMVDKVVDIAVVPRGRLLLVLRMNIRDGRIASIHAVADPDTLARSEIVLLDG
jgi:RNA polymerase sigma-70 factor (ECF subfamily)